MRALKVLGALCIGFAGILAFITTFIAIGYAIKILAVLGAIIGVLGLIGFGTWAAVYEFILLPRKHKDKPP